MDVWTRKRRRGGSVPSKWLAVAFWFCCLFVRCLVYTIMINGLGAREKRRRIGCDQSCWCYIVRRWQVWMLGTNNNNGHLGALEISIAFPYGFPCLSSLLAVLSRNWRSRSVDWIIPFLALLVADMFQICITLSHDSASTNRRSAANMNESMCVLRWRREQLARTVQSVVVRITIELCDIWRLGHQHSLRVSVVN